MTPPSADDQTEPRSGFPAWSLHTEVARLRELLRQREEQLEHAEAELTRLRAERDELNAQLAEHAAATQHYLQQAADAKVLLREDRAKSTALLIDLRALVGRIQVIIGGLDREIARQQHERAIYCEGKISAFKWVERELTKRLSREPHQDDK